MKNLKINPWISNSLMLVLIITAESLLVLAPAYRGWRFDTTTYIPLVFSGIILPYFIGGVTYRLHTKDEDLRIFSYLSIPMIIITTITLTLIVLVLMSYRSSRIELRDFVNYFLGFAVSLISILTFLFGIVFHRSCNFLYKVLKREKDNEAL
ncbi:MAG: hypothetical protein KAS63_05435 [Candidatus Heimdallarchaeota archaeon]|nr:hypothetical protein [Candidatus Heimdallarchaeota archaeon]MCK4954780.1 hypothetical protein [Candidatus Heimdallarchaeota archaeon]